MRNTGVTVSVIIIVIILIIVGIVYSNRESQSVVTPTPTVSASNDFALMSTAFADGGSIPSVYTCEGQGVNPPLTFVNVPAGTQSFALTMYDPDVPTQVRPEGFFDHWNVFNIPATTSMLEASSTIGTKGLNGSGKPGYAGPCPPTQYEPKEHRYIFTLYALDSILPLSSTSTGRTAIETAISGHVFGKAVLTGKYQKMATSTTQ